MLAVVLVMALAFSGAQATYFAGDGGCDVEQCYQRCEVFAQQDMAPPQANFNADLSYFENKMEQYCKRGCDNYQANPLKCEFNCTKYAMVEQGQLLVDFFLYVNSTILYANSSTEDLDIPTDGFGVDLSIQGFASALQEVTQGLEGNTTDLAAGAAIVNNLAGYIARRLNIILKLKDHCHAGCAHQTVQCQKCTLKGGKYTPNCACADPNCKKCFAGACLQCEGKNDFDLVNGLCVAKVPS